MDDLLSCTDNLIENLNDNKGPYTSHQKAEPFTLSKFFTSIQYYFLQNVVDGYIRNPEKYVYQYVDFVNGKRRKIVTYRRSTTEGQQLEHLHRLFALALKSTYEPHQLSFAYQKEKNILMCLNEHIYSDTFLKADIHSYFDTISYELLLERIQDVSKCPKYRKSALKKIVAVCFYKGHLPIGFVSSPILSDIYLKDLDDRMSAIDNICYSRYADDFIISSSGDGAQEHLKCVKNQLQSELARHKLELNDKKTFEHSLKNDGDSIRLLGLNLIKSNELANRITVSHKCLVDTSKEIGFLLQNKDIIEPWEMRRRFTSVMGKVSFIMWASKESATKLQKLLKIKTGLTIELTYSSLLGILIEDSSVIHKYEQEKQFETYARLGDLTTQPLTIGRCWETVIIHSSDKSHRRSLVHYLMNSIFPSTESGTSSTIRISRISLDVGEDRFVFSPTHDTKCFGEALKRIRSVQTEVRYNADFLFCAPLSSPSSNRRILFNEASHEWQFKGYEEKPAGLEEIAGSGEWRGHLSINLGCPIDIIPELSERIDLAYGHLDRILSPLKPEGTPDISRSHSVMQDFDFKMKSDQLISLMDVVRNLFSLMKQTRGFAEVYAWFVPVDFLETANESRFRFFEITSKNGKYKIVKRED